MGLLRFVVVLFIANSRHFAQGKGEYVLQTLIRQALYGYIFVYILSSFTFNGASIICQPECEIDLDDENLKELNTIKKIYPLIVDASGDIIYPTSQKKLVFGTVFVCYSILQILPFKNYSTLINNQIY